MTALVLAAIAYAPTLARGIVNYDDQWLVDENWILRDPSAASLHAMFFDLARETRFVLGAEYLPVRDLSVMLDHAIWGSTYAGHHFTNLLVYLLSIATWFAALQAFGIERRTAALAVLVWAVLPVHAESVAWLSERKGLLAMLFAGVAALGYARFRERGRGAWLVAATIAAVATVWSKAPFVFAIAALAGLEVILPPVRRAWRRSVAGLAAVGVASLAAFVPVLYVASDMSVIVQGNPAPAGTIEMAVGLHGFYLRLALMTVRNAVSYPIATSGPAIIDLIVGTLGLLIVVVVIAIPRSWLRVPSALRAAALLWLVGWFPVSRLVLPLKAVLVADRYLLLPSLGLALAAAVGFASLASVRARRALIGAVVLAGLMRTLDAQSSWRDSGTLWHQAVVSNPADGHAWSMYTEALIAEGRTDIAMDVLAAGLRRSRAPRLLLRKALALLELGKRSDAVTAMRAAAEAGEVRAMANLALLLGEDGHTTEALQWARRATTDAPLYAQGHRTHGKLALAAGQLDEALEAFERAHKLFPDVANRFNLALGLLAKQRANEARPLLESCIADPALGAPARARLQQLPP